MRPLLLTTAGTQRRQCLHRTAAGQGQRLAGDRRSGTELTCSRVCRADAKAKAARGHSLRRRCAAEREAWRGAAQQRTERWCGRQAGCGRRRCCSTHTEYLLSDHTLQAREQLRTCSSRHRTIGAGPQALGMVDVVLAGVCEIARRGLLHLLPYPAASTMCSG